MGRRCPDLGGASDWLKRNSLAFQPNRGAAWIWVVMHNQWGVSVLITGMSFCEGAGGDLAKCRLFCQARFCLETCPKKHSGISTKVNNGIIE